MKTCRVYFYKKINLCLNKTIRTTGAILSLWKNRDFFTRGFPSHFSSTIICSFRPLQSVSLFFKLLSRTLSSQHSLTRGIAPLSLNPGLLTFNPFGIKPRNYYNIRELRSSSLPVTPFHLLIFSSSVVDSS